MVTTQIRPSHGGYDMKYLRGFASFWYHFIVGDDWRVAVGVVIGLNLCSLLVHAGHPHVWWLLPLLIVVMLTISLGMATRRR